LPRLYRTTPWIDELAGWVAGFAGNPLGAQVHNAIRLNHDFIAIWAEDVSFFDHHLPGFCPSIPISLGNGTHLRTTDDTPSMQEAVMQAQFVAEIFLLQCHIVRGDELAREITGTLGQMTAT
jgi:hypothetical protein